MTYTDEQKAEALTLYLEVGAAETARRLEIPPRTVRYWANQSDLATARTQNLHDAAAMLAASHQQMREEFKLRLMEKALDALDRMDQKHIDFRGKDAREVSWDVAPSGAFKDYATAAAILIDKYRLENGESTGRTESLTLTAGLLESEIQRLENELGKQASVNP